MQVCVIVFIFFVGAFAQNANFQQNLQQSLPQNITGEDRNIERPCDIFDIQCIRRYFAKNSNCKPKYGHVPEPLYRPYLKVFLGRLNMTLDSYNNVYRGLNGRIQEFYVNRETDKVVLGVEFRNLYTASNTCDWRFHRRAREPIVERTYFAINYRSLYATIIIPQRKNLQLQRGETFTFVDETFPQLVFGPITNPDPTVQQAQAEILLNVPNNLLEIQLTEGPFYISTFIQYTLCDFGLKIL